MKTYIQPILWILAFVASIGVLIASDNAVKADVEYLRCNIGNEKVKIDGDRITDFKDGIWFFEGGYARNCEVFRTPKQFLIYLLLPTSVATKYYNQKPVT